MTDPPFDPVIETRIAEEIQAMPAMTDWSARWDAEQAYCERWYDYLLARFIDQD